MLFKSSLAVNSFLLACVNSPATYVGAGGIMAKRIPVNLNEKTLIAEGYGLLLIQVPYSNAGISCYMISPSGLTVIREEGNTSARISIEKQKVYYTETDEGSTSVYIQTALAKDLYYIG